MTARDNEIALLRAIDAIATLLEQGKPNSALRSASASVEIFPLQSEIWRLLGIAQLQVGDRGAAKSAFLRAAELAPRSVEILCNLASLASLEGTPDVAKDYLQRALEIDPVHAPAWNNLGRLLHDDGAFVEASLHFERSVGAQPDYADAWLNFANAQAALFDFRHAEQLARRGVNLNPHSADGWYLLGFLFERQGKLRDAVAAYRASLQHSARARTSYNLALVLDQLGDLPGSKVELEKTLRHEPNMPQALAQLVMCKRQLCDWDGLALLSEQLLNAVDRGVAGITPFSFLVEDATPMQQLRCARSFAQQFLSNSARSGTSMTATLASVQNVSATNGSPPANVAVITPSLRVGFVSSGFGDHATGLLVVELIEQLRATLLTTLGFATTAAETSPIRARIVAGFDDFHDVSAQSVATIDQLIRRSRCDILIDVDGYCMGSTPALFAAKPAPIQVSWLAYPGTMGAPWYDYLIADSYVVPPQFRDAYDERIAFLPGCYQPTDTTRVLLPSPTREACGLPASTANERVFVFCCFNNSWKITPASFDAWMRILTRVPRSVLWLLSQREENQVELRLRDAARRAGVDPHRLIFSPKLNHAQYLARFQLADLFLDTNPYGAHTTASDALFAGCPVLTRPGATFAARVAGSLNHTLGLNALICDSEVTYVERAIELALNPERLQLLRAQLAEPARRARLFDMRAYAQAFAKLLSCMAENARAGNPLREISL